MEIDSKPQELEPWTPDYAARNRARGVEEGEGQGQPERLAALEKELADLREESQQLTAAGSRRRRPSRPCAAPRRRSSRRTSHRTSERRADLEEAARLRYGATRVGAAAPPERGAPDRDAERRIAVVEEEVDAEDIARSSPSGPHPISRCWRASGPSWSGWKSGYTGG